MHVLHTAVHAAHTCTRTCTYRSLDQYVDLDLDIFPVSTVLLLCKTERTSLMNVSLSITV